MIVYILRRLAYLIPVILCVTTLVATMTHFIPGDPVERILPEFASAEQKATVRTQLGLDKTVVEQISSYFFNAIQFDLGTSISNQEPVLDLIVERSWPTIELALLSILLAICISIPLGIISALRPNTFADFAATFFSLIGVSMPNFWLGPLLIILFSVQLNLLPASGRNGFLSYILPMFTLGTALAAVLSRMTRTSVLEQLGADYVKTAYSKGLSYFSIIYVHVLKNASIPIVTVIGLQFGVLLTGAIVTEKIFDWPGLGSLMINAIQERDYPVIQGLVMLFSSSYLVINLFTDVLYAFLDPRIKLK